MSLALLAGANPRACGVTPKIRLYDGNWKIRHVGVVDSKLSLHDGEVVKGNCDIQVCFTARGTEEYISVYAEPIHGT